MWSATGIMPWSRHLQSNPAGPYPSVVGLGADTLDCVKGFETDHP